MDTVSWVLLMLAAVVTCACLGYLLGRRDSPKQAEIDRLEEELEAARARAEQVRAGVTTHFEHSAALFGQLAKDYGAFLSHFARSARELGLSEGRTEELIEQVTRPLLTRADDAVPPAPPADATPLAAARAGAAAPASEQSPASEEPTKEPTGEPSPADVAGEPPLSR